MARTLQNDRTIRNISICGYAVLAQSAGYIRGSSTANKARFMFQPIQGAKGLIQVVP